MTYMQGYRGDYMGGYRGDPGLFGSIFGGIKRVVGAAARAAPGPIGWGARALFPRKRPPAPVVPFMPPQVPVTRKPGWPGRMERLLPGGKTGFEVAMPGMRPRYRRMNVANPKALRRAIRRQAGFVKLARKALRGTGYSIVSKGSRRPTRPVSIRESGPGSVIVR